MVRRALASIFLVLLLTPSNASAQLAPTILSLTGQKRVKIVWMRDTTASGTNVFGEANVFELRGYDTDTDTVSVIKSTHDDYTKPLITHDGTRIVYTDRLERKIRVVNWNGSNQRHVANGFAGAVWRDPATGKEWVYYQQNGDGDNSSNALRRVNLDNTSESQLVWDDTQTNLLWLAISGDGARLTGSWPWDNCGAIEPNHAGGGGGNIYYPPTGHYTTGCWTTITPDTRYKVGVFDGPHRGWKVWDWPTGSMRTVDLHSAPGINGWEIYHPKHSNHPQFITMTGPYSQGSMGSNNIFGGGPQVEVYFGKLDAGFTQVTTWRKVTSNNRADFFPCAWVDPVIVYPVQIDTFTANPGTIDEGNAATLSWSTSNATAVSITPGIGSVSADGSRSVSPAATTTYTLTADGHNGPISQQATVTVTPNAVQIDSFGGAPAAIASGEAATLTWSTSNATSVAITPGIGSVSADGSRSVSPAATKTYTLTAEGPGGPISRRTTIIVIPSGTIHLKINSGDGSPSVSGWMDEEAFRSTGNQYDFVGASVDLNGQPNPADPNLYLTCVHTDHAYSFPVSDGHYTVRLHFFDQYPGGGRFMDYSIEGVKVLDDFNINVETGGQERVLIREFDVDVTDGNGLQIVAEKDGGDDAFESGIEIITRIVDTTDPTVTLTAPSRQATITGEVTIEGTASDDVGLDKVEVKFGGGSFTDANGTTNFNITLPTSNLTNGPHTIVARATDLAGNSARSSIPITVDNSTSITLVSPAGGEIWEGGSLQQIQWSTHNLDAVTIYYTLDGVQYNLLEQTVRDSHPSWASYPWVLPEVPTSSAKVMIQGYFGESPTESGPFTITVTSSASISVTSPAAGVTLMGKEEHTIRFAATDGVAAVSLDYSLDGGNTWQAIGSVNNTDPDWGAVRWMVPNVSTNSAQVRVMASPELFGLSDLFTIEPATVPASDIEIETIRITAVAPAGMLETAKVLNQTILVSSEGQMTFDVPIPAGATSVVCAIEGHDADYSRIVAIDIEDRAAPIAGLSVNREELTTFLGGRTGVLVWVDAGGQIQQLDFRQTDPRVEVLATENACINPLVSFDGTRVVYSFGAPNGPKVIFARDLSGSGKEQIATGDIGFWNQNDGKDAIIYCDWSGKDDNGAGGATYRQELNSGTVEKKGAPTEIHDRAMDAGPNGDLTWLGQVFGSLFAYNLTTGREYGTDQFFLMEGPVADHQTCNGSMAPDSSGRLLELVDPHDWIRLFSHEASSDTFQETSRFELPPGFIEWRAPEWSTHPDFFTAGLRRPDLKNRIVIVKMAEGNVVPDFLEVVGEEWGPTYSHLYLEP